MTQVTMALWLLSFSGCATLHLPSLYARGSFTPAREGTIGAASLDRFGFDVGVVGDLGDATAAANASPEGGEDVEPASPFLVLPALPCRVSSACAWERRASAEARSRVIGRGAR